MSKGLEALKEIQSRWNWSNPNHNLEDNFELVENELKALDIIKNKIVDMALLLETFTYYKNGLKAYNTMRTRGYELTQEEYDSLKEVLL